MNGFVIDITPIKSGGVLPFDGSGTIAGNDYEADISVSGNAVNEENGRYSFSGRLSGDINTFCARCLANVSMPYESEIEFCFANVPENADDDALIFSGSLVDIKKAVEGFLAADMPVSVLCREDCRGLCQKCGRELNVSECGCEKDLINPVIDISKFK